MKTGLVTQIGFIQSCCVQKRVVKVFWNHAGSAHTQCSGFSREPSQGPSPMVKAEIL